MVDFTNMSMGGQIFDRYLINFSSNLSNPLLIFLLLIQWCYQHYSAIRGKIMRKTTEEFILQAKSVHGETYDYSKSVYIYAREKVIIICPLHGEFSATPDSHLRGSGCMACGHIKTNKSKTLPLKDFIDRVSKIHKNKYNYSHCSFSNLHEKIKIICPLHGGFLQEANAHLVSKQGCPKCSSSKGEILIRNILSNKKIIAIEQKRFSDCRYKHPLAFDFFLPEHNILLEYNGIQHYHPIPHFGGEEKLNMTRNYDKIKKLWAKRNGYKLITISYRVKNIEKYILSRIEKISLQGEKPII